MSEESLIDFSDRIDTQKRYMEKQAQYLQETVQIIEGVQDHIEDCVNCKNAEKPCQYAKGPIDAMQETLMKETMKSINEVIGKDG